MKDNENGKKREREMKEKKKKEREKKRKEEGRKRGQISPLLENQLAWRRNRMIDSEVRPESWSLDGRHHSFLFVSFEKKRTWEERGSKEQREGTEKEKAQKERI